MRAKQAVAAAAAFALPNGPASACQSGRTPARDGSAPVRILRRLRGYRMASHPRTAGGTMPAPSRSFVPNRNRFVCMLHSDIASGCQARVAR
jgi:hypothetical protein